MKRALIVLTKIPLAGYTKTRLMPYLSGEECARLHTAFLRDIAASAKEVSADLFVVYAGGTPELLQEIFPAAQFFPQEGKTLGERMQNAMARVFREGYARCLLIGTDIPYLDGALYEEAFARLEECDAVFGPAQDGGYWLIGLKEMLSELFSLSAYSHSRVLEETLAALPAGRTAAQLPELRDTDEIEDLLYCRARAPAGSHTAEMLAQIHVLSVIIPVYNEEKRVDRLLAELRKLPHGEVIFVDGGSSDGTRERLRAGMGTNCVLLESKRGRGTQLCAGAAAARGDLFFFLHADATLPEDAEEEILRVMRDHEFGAFGIAFRGGDPLMRINAWLSNRRAFRRGIVFGDQGMFMRRRFYEANGGYPQLPLMEDYRFSLNARCEGSSVGRTAHCLTVSDRRYRGGMLRKLKVMWQMYHLRRQYLAGHDVEELAKKYQDIR